MTILTNISNALRRNECQKLIKRTANEIAFTGLDLVTSNTKVDIASFSNKILTRATELAFYLDDYQYLLCKEIPNLKNTDPLRDDFKRIRLQLILGIEQLKSILSTLEGERVPEKTRKELTDWIKYTCKY